MPSMLKTSPFCIEIKTRVLNSILGENNINFILEKTTPMIIESICELNRGSPWMVFILFGRKNVEGGGLNFDTESTVQALEHASHLHGI